MNPSSAMALVSAGVMSAAWAVMKASAPQSTAAMRLFLCVVFIVVSFGFIYPALLATPSPARGTGVGHGSSGHPDDVDKQGASSPIGWRSAFENARVVGEIVTGELR